MPARCHTHQRRPQMQACEAAPVGVDLLGDVDDRLAHLDQALDDPIERAALEDLRAPRRHHASVVAQAPAPLQAARLILLKLLDALAPDAELAQMQRPRFPFDFRTPAPSTLARSKARRERKE